MLATNLSSTSSATATTATRQTDIGQKDIFLKLLVAQMENQDPLKPQDATQMSSQLAQFNMVEQQTQSNKYLEQMVAAGGASSSVAQPGTGASYLGHSVTVNQDQLLYDGTSQNFTAVLDEPATDVLAFVFDGAGNPVRTMQFANLPAGATSMVWDGTLDSGAIAPQGNYSVQLSPLNINGAEVGYAIQRTGQVDAVRFNATGTELMVGGVATSIANITELRL
ncbi:MAG: flagellar hook capping FlgD N-terminal domain-containing protein [Mariprofundus sp.]|nr:flagellar hook capping FlgD N-terminal domain-containing protein [Mariprofundus sp.]